jgi:hypothetical protein
MSKVQKFLVDIDLNGKQIKNAVLGTVAGSDNGSIWFDVASGLVKFVDGAGTTQATAPQSAVDTAIAGVSADLATAVTTIEGLISAETAAREAAVAAVASDLSDEVSARQSAVSAVASDLSTEVSAREAAVAAVASDLSDEVSAREAAVSAVASDLSTESARAIAAENALDDAILAEVSAREAANSTLDTRVSAVEADLAALDTNFATDASVAAVADDLATESARAIAAENALDDAIIAEVSAREAADSTLQTNVDAVASDLSAENSRALAAEGVLDTAITAEVSARESADSTLQSNIDAVASDLSTENSRAVAAENALDDAITAEVSAREAADSTLQTNVDAVASDLSSEVSRATAAEGALDVRVSDVEEVIPTLATSAQVTADLATATTSLEAYADAAALAAETAAKAHADLISQGLNVKEAVRTVVFSDGTLEDGITPNQAAFGIYTPFGNAPLQAGDRVIYGNFSGAGEQGTAIYVVSEGAWSLAADWENDTDKSGSFVYVEEGPLAGSLQVFFYEPTLGALVITQLAGPFTMYGEAGITVDGTGIGIDIESLVSTYAVARKATALVGNDDDKSFTISHVLGQDVIVSVREVATNEIVTANVSCSTGSVTVSFHKAPEVDEFKVIIIG